jgi:hypothetical protein
MRLIGVFVDSYLKLDTREQARFDRSMERVSLTPVEKEKIVEYTTSWEQAGIEKGLAQGLERGRQEAVEALRGVLLEVLVTRFGAVPAAVAKRIRGIDSMDGLRDLTHRALTATSLSELGLLRKTASPRR